MQDSRRRKDSESDTNRKSLTEASQDRPASRVTARASDDPVSRVWRDKSVELISVRQLKPNPRNARTHSDKQITQLAAIIDEVGFYAPLIIDEDNNIIAGHGRLAASNQIGLAEVPVIRATNLSPQQIRAFALADNRIAELAEWDLDILRIEIEGLLQFDSDLDIEITGFDTVDIDRILADEGGTSTDDPADVCPPPETRAPAITRPGDVWILGDHRIICADARDQNAYDLLFDGAPAQMCFTDPPYNVRIEGHVSGKGKAQHDEFMMASGEMSSDEFAEFLGDVFEPMAQNSCDGAIHFVCMDWRHQLELLDASEVVFGAPKNMCVWVKDNAGMGSFYRSAHELVYVFKSGSGKHINNFGLGERGRYRTNVWKYAGVNSFGKTRERDLAMHPTVKPVALVADAIRDCSKRKGVILDPFGGSGTTLIAAERTGRCARLIELDPYYVDVTIRRWQEFTGLEARHGAADATEATFTEIEAQRSATADAVAVARERPRSRRSRKRQQKEQRKGQIHGR